jgi:uncharacterized protein with PQ loop repeat
VLTSQIIANVCQGAVVPVCLIGYVPQWRTILRNKSSRNVSLSSQLLWGFATVLSIVYAALQYSEFGACSVLLASSCINLICQCFTAGLILNFSDKNRTSHNADFGKLTEMLAELDRTTRDVKEIEKAFDREYPESLNVKNIVQPLSS